MAAKINEDFFNCYVKPTTPITTNASDVTGIVMHEDQMFVNGREVETVDVSTALKNLCDFVQKYRNVIIVAHNGKQFDFPILISNMQELHLLDIFMSAVVAMADSLQILKKQYPGYPSYQQSARNKFP